MASPAPTIRIGVYGTDSASKEGRGFNLWPAGYVGAVTAAGATPILLRGLAAGECWKEVLHGIDGIVFTESPPGKDRSEEDEHGLVRYCRDYKLPFLGIDLGLHVLNTSFNGTLHEDLSRELPEALQHRHPPERGLRHAINVLRGTRLAGLYGEGEVVVNSEHRRGVQRLARGFRVSATALDGVVEAIESEDDEWFALGVQWHPASASASGLDIQVFRGLIDACQGTAEVAASAA